MASWLLKPMPLSVMVSVLASLSKLMRTFKSGSVSNNAALLSDSKRNLSQASDALDTSSRKKISGLEYSECVTNLSSWATSA